MVCLSCHVWLFTIEELKREWGVDHSWCWLSF